MDFFYVAYLKTKWRNSFKTKFSFNTSFMGKMQFFHGEVSTWEIVIWEISFGKLPHGKLHIWEVDTWEIVTWEVALGKIPF